MTALRVAVTGATGEIGRPFVRQLETIAEVRKIRAMARRSFAPSKQGWTRTTFVRGDVTIPRTSAGSSRGLMSSSTSRS